MYNDTLYALGWSDDIAYKQSMNMDYVKGISYVEKKIEEAYALNKPANCAKPTSALYIHNEKMIKQMTSLNSDFDDVVRKFALAYGNNMNEYVNISLATGIP